MEAQLETLDPASHRYQVLAAARDFKASWVALGQRLTEVRDKEGFREWGYASFEAYCRRELRIKPETADKLTRSYHFLHEARPSALKERGARELPPLEVIDLLAQARERSRVSANDARTIRDEVFDGDLDPTRANVLRRFREFDPEAFKAPRAKAPEGGDVRRALLLAERLQSLLEVIPGISRDSLTGVRATVAELREQFSEQRSA